MSAAVGASVCRHDVRRPDRRPLDPESQAWLRDLRGGGTTARQAERRLHGLLLRLAYAELARRGQPASAERDLDDLVQQAADDALVAVLAKLDQFRGASSFVTWAARFVLLEVTSKLSRHYVQQHERRVFAADWSVLPEPAVPGPDEHVTGRALADALRLVLAQDLTHHQRRVFRAVVLDDRPVAELARELGCRVNAVHKTMSDARQRLRVGLALRGY